MDRRTKIYADESMSVENVEAFKTLDMAIEFYGKLVGAEVNTTKPGYANFAIDSPLVKLVLNETQGAAERLKANGIIRLIEENKTCCYANADKVSATDPDGLQWEWYRVLGGSETFGVNPEFGAAKGVCR